LSKLIKASMWVVIYILGGLIYDKDFG